MSIKWDQSRAWQAIANAAPTMLGPSWRVAIVKNTPIDFHTLSRWENGLSNPGANRMLPRLELIGRLMTQHISDFERAFLAAARTIAENGTVGDLDGPEAFDSLAKMSEIVFGPCWQKPLSEYLRANHGVSVSHSSFSIWKSERKSRRRLLKVIEALIPEFDERLRFMERANLTFGKEVADMSEDFPISRSVKLIRNPSALAA